MKIVKNENPFIAAILGKQSYDSINKYKFGAL